MFAASATIAFMKLSKLESEPTQIKIFFRFFEQFLSCSRSASFNRTIYFLFMGNLRVP